MKEVSIVTMNKLFFLLLLGIIIFSYHTIACQYTIQEQYQEIETALTYQDSTTKIADALVLSEFTNSSNTTAFTVYNPNPFEIQVLFKYNLEGFKTGEQQKGLQIQAKSYDKIKEICYKDDNFGQCNINRNNVAYYLVKPELLFPKQVNVNKTRTVCKLCNNVPCLDDGSDCSTKEQCGGDYCVENICNNKPECFMDNCKCERFDKIQCKNARCVLKNVLPEGDVPYCGPLECMTNYTDDSGRCAKSPSQRENEKEQKVKDKAFRDAISLILIIITILAIIVLAIYFNKKNIKIREDNAKKKAREAANREYEEAKKVQELAHNEYIKKTNLLIQNIRAQEEALADKKRRLSESRRMLTEAEDNFAKTKQIKDKEESEIREILQKEKDFSESKAKLKDLAVPRHSLTRAFWEWSNPNIKNTYYPCYVNQDASGGYTIKTDKEIHKDLAEKEIFHFYKSWFIKHYPGKSFKDLVVHHIDKNIFNYELENLAIISHNEHEKLHKKSQHKNWESGVRELKELGIKQPHIDELGGKSITDPYEILGVSRNASKEEIKTAYYKLSSQNHPDKVTHLDKQFQILAESRIKKINAAYHELVD